MDELPTTQHDRGDGHQGDACAAAHLGRQLHPHLLDDLQPMQCTMRNHKLKAHKVFRFQMGVRNPLPELVLWIQVEDFSLLSEHGPCLVTSVTTSDQDPEEICHEAGVRWCDVAALQSTVSTVSATLLSPSLLPSLHYIKDIKGIPSLCIPFIFRFFCALYNT